MIVFDQLRISDDGMQLYIDLHVSDIDAYNSFYLDTLVIKSSAQVSETTLNSTSGENIYEKTFEGELKEAHLVLTPADFNTHYTQTSLKDLFFVFVKCKTSGAVNPCFECLPCNMQETEDVGVTFDTGLFYQQVMQYTRELADTCTIPKNFIDLILLWNGFNAAVETEHYLPAIDFYNKMFGKGSIYKGTYSQRGCGCHG
jgi:hypothetical protein